MSDWLRTPEELRAIAEAVADVLEERGLVAASPVAVPARVLDAATVAELLGRDRQWVYAHADELGAFRYSEGPRARLGFDAKAVERWKRRGQAPAAPSRSAGRRVRRTAAAAAPFLIPYEGSGRGA